MLPAAEISSGPSTRRGTQPVSIRPGASESASMISATVRRDRACFRLDADRGVRACATYEPPDHSIGLRASRRRWAPRRSATSWLSPSSAEAPLATMATLAVRSRALPYSSDRRKPNGKALHRTHANGRQRSPRLAMQKVVGSSPIIRSESPNAGFASRPRGRASGLVLCRWPFGQTRLCGAERRRHHDDQDTESQRR